VPGHGLDQQPACPADPREEVHIAIVGFILAICLNFLGFNPMKALVWSGIVQGFSTPPLMLLILLMTNSRAIMGERVNSRLTNVLGWITAVAIFPRAGVSW
jgi:Mn2+/Fe2+ NRAMP family transporter